LIGAVVTVLDITEAQLERDQQALAHYALQARLEQGDMRDLSRFEADSFDLVWNAWSINFVPDTAPVFDEVSRVLRPGGLYQLSWGNPFTSGIDETDWTGDGYALRELYADGEVHFAGEDWEFEDIDGTARRVASPREFKHTLGTVVNGLIQRGFMLRGLWEAETGDADAPPGTWEHLKAIAPHDLTLWAVYGA
jgi:ubiquinone/menaquinone biosynthesis C-methylase UbiE